MALRGSSGGGGMSLGYKELDNRKLFQMHNNLCVKLVS